MSEAIHCWVVRGCLTDLYIVFREINELVLIIFNVRLGEHVAMKDNLHAILDVPDHCEQYPSIPQPPWNLAMPVPDLSSNGTRVVRVHGRLS